MRSYFGSGDARGIDRAKLADVVTQLKQLTPMVAANYVKVLPVSYLFEAPEHLPIYYPENRFSDVLPSDLLSFFHEHMRVEPLRRRGAAWTGDPSASVSRYIAVEFGDDNSAGMLYQLFQQEIESIDEATRKYTARLSIPETPPTREYYDAWVEQSVNKTAINYYDRLRTEVALSLQLGASYMCFSKFRRDLLAKFFQATVNTAEHTADVLLKVDVPFLDEIDTEVLMSVRRDEGEAFRAFRRELEGQFWDLRMEEDPERLRIKAQKAIHELGTAQCELLTEKLNQIRRGALADTVISLAALAGTIISGHYLPALIGTAAGAYRLKTRYAAELRQHPSFFLWKAHRSS